MSYLFFGKAIAIILGLLIIIYDWRYRAIPVYVVLLFAVLSNIWGIFNHADLPLLTSIGVITLLIFLYLAYRQLIGIADSVLIPCCFAWFSLEHIPLFLILCSIFGVITALFWRYYYLEKKYPFAPAILFSLAIVFSLLKVDMEQFKLDFNGCLNSRELSMLSGSQRKCISGVSPKKIVVLLHGYGANGANLIDLADEWGNLMPEVEFHAPNGLESCASGGSGFQWFSLKEFSPTFIRHGLDKAMPALKEYLNNLLASRNLQESDLALVGFSQGAMLALEMMFHLPELAGVIGYSGAFYPPSLNIENFAHKPKPEVLLIHGTADTVVPYQAMIESDKNLKNIGFKIKTYSCQNLGHSIDNQGVKLGGQFLINIFDQKYKNN